MRQLLLITFILVLGSVPSPTLAAPPKFECSSEFSGDRSEAVRRVEQTYRGLQSLTAKFRQRSYFIGLDQREESEGQVYFEKPGKMNWVYTAPEPQTFVSDGETVSYYQPKLKQVTLSDFTNSFQSDLPVTFLLGIGSLSESFTTKEGCAAEDNLLFTFAPKKPDSHLESFSLLVDRKSWAPVGARTRDIGGNETEITFVELTTNPAIPPKTFALDIPKGTDIIDQRQRVKMGALSDESGEIAESDLSVSVEDVTESEKSK